MRFVIIALLPFLTAPEWLDSKENTRLRKMWPTEIAGERPPNLWFYKRATETQRLTELVGHPDVQWVSIEDGTNDEFPWATPGGLHQAARGDYRSHVGISLPADAKIAKWVEKTWNIGAYIPNQKWSYPDNTVFVDLLTDRAGRLFEIRTLTKYRSGWEGERVFTNKRYRPRGWLSVSATANNAGLTPSAIPTNTCASCHAHAGESRGYANALRGGDGIFSFNPFR
jgi:hypothetical protein